MEKLDVKAELKCIIEHQEMVKKRDGKGWLEFYPYSLEWAEGIEIESDFKTRPFTFECGTEDQVADELTIKIKFPKGTDIQPHDDFASDFGVECLKAAMHNMNGHIENS